MNDYSDIINLPRHVSSRHAPMTPEGRAAQFNPFAALTGYSDALEETERLTDERRELSQDSLDLLDIKLELLCSMLSSGRSPAVSVSFYDREASLYKTVNAPCIGVFKIKKQLILEGGTVIDFDSLEDISSGDFPDFL